MLVCSEPYLRNRCLDLRKTVRLYKAVGKMHTMSDSAQTAELSPMAAYYFNFTSVANH